MNNMCNICRPITFYNNFIPPKEHDMADWEFCSFGPVDGIHDNQSILLCIDGSYSIDSDMKRDIWDDKLQCIKDLPESSRKALLDTITELKELKHGALMIISKDAEADRICLHYKRGIKINPLDLSTSTGRSLFAGLSSIDGASLVDFNAKCHAYSVILDGNANIKGDLGKGARHNSASNYVANGKDRYAIVISEDRENEIKIYP